MGSDDSGTKWYDSDRRGEYRNAPDNHSHTGFDPEARIPSNQPSEFPVWEELDQIYPRRLDVRRMLATRREQQDSDLLEILLIGLVFLILIGVGLYLT